MRHARSLATIGLTLVLAGCDVLGPPEACTADLRPGIVVEIRDATTDAYIAERATAIATADGFRDSLRLRGGVLVGEEFVRTTRAGADERAGTYTLEVTAPGYAPWVRTGVRVREDDCHVRTVSLVARLEPAPR